MEYNGSKVSEPKEVAREITKVSEFEAKNMIFHDPESGSVPEAGKEKNFKYKRVNISTKYLDGTEGPLILQTERCFSFGVQKNSGFKQISYSLPIVLYDRTPQGNATLLPNKQSS